MYRKLFFLFLALFHWMTDTFGQQPQLLLPVGHSLPVSDVYFSPDGSLAVTNGGEEKNVKIWEAQTGKLIRTIDAHADEITSVSFSPDGKYLLTTGHDRSAKIWDIQSGSLYYSINYFFSNWIEKGFFSNDGKKVLLISDDAMEYHDVTAKKLLRSLVDTISFRDRGVMGKFRYRFNSYDMSRDGRLTITANTDSSIKIWDNNTGKIIRKITNQVPSYHVCSFNPSGHKFLATSQDATYVWETTSTKLLRTKKAEKGLVIFSSFHPVSEMVLTSMIDTITMNGALELWDIKAGAVLRSFTQPELKAVISATFSKDGKLLLTMSIDGKARLWETQTGKLLRVVATPDPALNKVMGEIRKDEFLQYTKAAFSPDSKFIIAASLSNVATIQETISGKKTAELEGISSMIRMPCYSPDGKLLATAGNKGIIDLAANPQGYVTVWDLATGNVLYELKGHKGIITDIGFSADNTRIATASEDSTVRIWERYSGKLLKVITGHEQGVYNCYFADSSRYLVTQTFNGQARLWDTETGLLVTSLRHEKATGDSYGVYTSTPSATLKYFKTVFYDDYKTVITESTTGRTIFSFVPGKDSISFFIIDPSDKYFVYNKANKIMIKGILSGQTSELPELQEFKGLQPSVTDALPGFTISTKGNLIAYITKDSLLRIASFPSGKVMSDAGLVSRGLSKIEFTSDEEFLLTEYYDGTIKVWDVAKGRPFTSLKTNDDDMFSFTLTRDNNHYIVTRSFESVLKVWDIATGRVISSVLDKFNSSLTYNTNPVKAEFIIDNKYSIDLYKIGSSSPVARIASAGDAGYLITDSAGRFDGSNEARKLLYFTCGTEIISLDQVKDQLWVPGLAERILRGDTIRSKSINEMNICGLTPQVKDVSNNETEYNYMITPRRGGLGETVLYVNGIEAKRYKTDQLTRTGSDYRLQIKRSELSSWFVTGQTNRVSVKAYTTGNDISSRSVIDDDEGDSKTTAAPNLYAVMIGVSDYKGDELDLKYAGKDALDISNVVAVSARKLLNSDGKEHVFIYNLNTEKNHSGFPDKNSIMKAFAEIGKKALPNDILLMFFAGHGMMSGEKKQFYFLTADASRSTAAEATADVGISTAEISEWMKPQNIKAQKRILIFDACNSGQAIRDFVKMGGEGQDYMAARDDEKTQQIKAIEKLNEKSGLFILSASASNQKAYEMTRYSQGVLTYSLLKAIKQQPDILDNGKYLNIGRWFGAAEKEVNDLSNANGVRQQPQVVSNTNFNIGIVDAEVTAGILLPQEKPVFTASNFWNNDRNIADDDLDLSRLLNLQLSDVSSRSGNSPIVYATATSAPDAYTMTGGYDVKGNAIVITVNVKQDKLVKFRFEQKGEIGKMNELADGIINEALKRLTKPQN